MAASRAEHIIGKLTADVIQRIMEMIDGHPDANRAREMRAMRSLADATTVASPPGEREAGAGAGAGAEAEAEAQDSRTKMELHCLARQGRHCTAAILACVELSAGLRSTAPSADAVEARIILPPDLPAGDSDALRHHAASLLKGFEAMDIGFDCESQGKSWQSAAQCRSALTTIFGLLLVAEQACRVVAGMDPRKARIVLLLEQVLCDWDAADARATHMGQEINALLAEIDRKEVATGRIEAAREALVREVEDKLRTERATAGSLRDSLAEASATAIAFAAYSAQETEGLSALAAGAKARATETERKLGLSLSACLLPKPEETISPPSWRR
jgi:hypothetical protein